MAILGLLILHGSDAGGRRGWEEGGKGGGGKEGNDPHSFALFIVFAEIWRQYLHS